MTMRKFKDKIYDKYVRSNPDIRYEYERYVIENISEHNSRRLKHWMLLLRLNIHYVVMKKKAPLMFFDSDSTKRFAILDNSNINTKKRNVMPISGKDKGKHSDKFSSPVSENHNNISEFELIDRQPIDDLVSKLQQYDVVSFDMFDTLVFRDVERPTDVFWMIGNEFCIPNFKRIRINIEKELREKSESNEVTLNDIYREINLRYGIQNGEDVEIKFEKIVCKANPYMLEVFRKLKKINKTVIVTTNMYLPQNTLAEILEESGYIGIKDIFVSCEYEANKALGKLQMIVKDILGHDKSYIHVGDNYYLDIEGSRIAGWSAYHYKNITELGSKYRPEDMSTIPGSIYKALTNQKIHNGLQYNPYYKYGYAYSGYLVYGFCRWLEEIAKERKIDLFLFVSRDMYVVEKVYKKYFNSVPSEYIKASRTSSIHLSFDRHIEHFCDWHLKRRLSSNETIEQVFDELNYSFLTAILDDYDLESNEILTKNNYDTVKQIIYDNKKTILKMYEEERNAAYQYYSEIIGSCKNVCIVDLGWKASTYNSLKEFLLNEKKMNIKLSSAMIGMEGHEFVDNMMSYGDIYTYVFSKFQNRDLMLEHNKNGYIWRRLYEIIFTSNENSLLRFKLGETNNIEFEFLRKEIRDDDILDNLHNGIIDFAHDIYKIENKLGYKLNIPGRDAYLPLQKIFYNETFNLSLFKDFEVAFIAGDIKKDNVELFKDVVNERK